MRKTSKPRKPFISSLFRRLCDGGGFFLLYQRQRFYRPCFRCSGSTAKQHIMFLLREKRRTPMIVPWLLTHNACFLFMNFSTVCSCSSIHASVSRPGKFQLTFLTSCIHELIQELSPNTASISSNSKISICRFVKFHIPTQRD